MVFTLTSFPPFTYDSWSQESLSIVPITDFNFSDASINLDSCLDHGFSDIPFFPTWKDFLERSKGNNPNYTNYMVFLLLKLHSTSDNVVNTKQIIGILAVQLIDYNLLKEKNQAIIPSINNYLYLSWIGLDKRFQSKNYFSILYEYYYTLIRNFRSLFKTNVEGAAIIIRRMRPIIWSLLNTEKDCPDINDNLIIEDTTRYKIHIFPSELFDDATEIPQDHLLLVFKTRKVMEKVKSI